MGFFTKKKQELNHEEIKKYIKDNTHDIDEIEMEFIDIASLNKLIKRSDTYVRKIEKYCNDILNGRTNNFSDDIIKGITKLYHIKPDEYGRIFNADIEDKINDELDNLMHSMSKNKREFIDYLSKLDRAEDDVRRIHDKMVKIHDKTEKFLTEEMNSLYHSGSSKDENNKYDILGTAQGNLEETTGHIAIINRNIITDIEYHTRKIKDKIS